MSWKKIAAGAALALSIAAPASAQLAESVAAIVNDVVISTYDVRQRANLLLVSNGVEPTAELQRRAAQAAREALIDEELQIQEATGEPYNLNIDDAEIDRRLDQIARSNNTTRALFEQSLAQSGVGITTLRHQIRADIAWNRLMGGLYSSRIRVSDVQIREMQERLAASATQPRYLISEIFLPAANEQEFTDMTNGGLRLIQQMQSGAAPFPAVARQFSASPSAAAGGDMGWLAASEMQPEIAAVVEQLQAGQVALRPIRTRDGVYIIALREKRQGVAAGAIQRVNIRQVQAPASRRVQLERMQRRVQGCGTLETSIADIQGAEIIDLGEATESDLSDAIRARIANVAAGAASPVTVDGEQASMVVVCTRETGGGGVPSRDEIENSLFEEEMAMLSDRHLRNVKREATIIRR